MKLQVLPRGFGGQNLHCPGVIFFFRSSPSRSERFHHEPPSLFARMVFWAIRQRYKPNLLNAIQVKVAPLHYAQSSSFLSSSGPDASAIWTI